MKCPQCRQRPLSFADWFDARRKQVWMPPRIVCQPCGAKLRPASPAHNFALTCAGVALGAGTAFAISGALGLGGIEQLLIYMVSVIAVESAVSYPLAKYKLRGKKPPAELPEARVD